jgi:CheY-like chemotaxis protein
MLEGLRILVAEDELLSALSMADAVWRAGGLVVGPVPSVVEAFEILGRVTIDAAILDVHLRDRNIAPVLAMLVDNRTPLVVHTGTGLPEELRHLGNEIMVVSKPSPPEEVLSALETVIERRSSLAAISRRPPPRRLAMDFTFSPD